MILFNVETLGCTSFILFSDYWTLKNYNFNSIYNFRRKSIALSLCLHFTNRVVGKPRNATAKSGTIGTKIGTKENIVLNVTAFPAPNVTWLRETNFEWNVLNERYDYKHKLNSTIHIKTKDDFGLYGIKICNKLGCIVENITLKPQGNYFVIYHCNYNLIG